MTLADLLAHPGMRPFEIAFAIVAGLLALELILNLLGLSALGGSESDAEVELDIEPAEVGPFDLDGVDLDGLDADATDALEADTVAADSATSSGADSFTPGLLSWLGLGQVPTTIWLASFLTGYALTGYLVQLGLSESMGMVLGAASASFIAVPVAVMFARVAARGIARLVPKTQTTAISRLSFHRRRAVITVGTARQGSPAQARFRDGHGNTHYTMVEPLDPKDVLPQGTEILILRARDGTPRAVALSEVRNSN